MFEAAGAQLGTLNAFIQAVLHIKLMYFTITWAYTYMENSLENYFHRIVLQNNVQCRYFVVPFDSGPISWPSLDGNPKPISLVIDRIADIERIIFTHGTRQTEAFSTGHFFADAQTTRGQACVRAPRILIFCHKCVLNRQTEGSALPKCAAYLSGRQSHFNELL